MSSRAQRRAMRRQQAAEEKQPQQQQQQQQQQKQQQRQGFSDRARQRQAQVRPSQQAIRGQTGRREAPRGSFVREAIAELRKVEWPDQRQVTTGTIVVIIACAICGAYLWLNDLLWQKVVETIL